MYPHCAACFGRCYPGGATLIMDEKNLYEGVSRLLTVSSSREVPAPAKNTEEKSVSENGDHPVVENGVTSGVEEAEVTNEDGKEQKSPPPETEEKGEA